MTLYSLHPNTIFKESVMPAKALSKKKAKIKKKSPPHTMAFHGKTTNGMHHVVGIGNLRVVLVPDGQHWFAQGLEIDYSAQGDDIEDAKRKFEIGLQSTVDEHLKIYGNMDKFLKVAPPEVWKEFLFDPLGKHAWYSQVSAHTIDRAAFFKTIEYLSPAA